MTYITISHIGIGNKLGMNTRSTSKIGNPSSGHWLICGRVSKSAIKIGVIHRFPAFIISTGNILSKIM